MSLFFKMTLCVCVAGLTACGGGSETPTTPTTPTTSCPSAQVDDAWVVNRLGCLRVGQKFIDQASGAERVKVDMAYIVNQKVYNNAFDPVGDGQRRYYKHFLCVKNAPTDISTMYLGFDLTSAIQVSNFSKLPTGVGHAAASISGGNQSGFAAIACDPKKHPIIVNYTTGLVESINIDALDGIEEYRLKD
jgi:hypothetical protein